MCRGKESTKKTAIKSTAGLCYLTTLIVALFALAPVSCGLTGGQVRDVSSDTSPQTGSDERRWMSPFADGLHDPTVPALKLLQSPSEALLRLPPGMGGGNQTNWVMALENRFITPLSSVYGKARIAGSASDILMKETFEMPMVLFPHDKHVTWLDCKNCHDGIFKKKAGATSQLNMYSILEGRLCGKCHGAVAFPLTDCLRCHSVSRGTESVQHKSLDEWW